MRTTSSRDNWERLVAAVIKRDQIWQLCHQDSITTVDSDFSQRDLSLRSVPSSPSRLPLTKDYVPSYQEAVVSLALETFRDLLLEEGRFLSGVGDEVKALQTQLKEMQSLLKDADGKQHESVSVRNWIAQIRDLAYRAEDVIETYAIEVSSKRGGVLKNLLRRFSYIIKESHSLHQLGSEISQIKADLAEISKRMQGYGIRSIIQGESSSANNNRQWKRQTFPDCQIQDCFVGRDDELKQIVSLLVDDHQHRILSIWGMGGLGKTTIARKAYNHADTKRYFQCFAWVCITQQCEIRSVLEDVLKQLNPSKRDVISSLSNREMIEELCQIQKDKRCMVVLDDLWETDHWDCLKHAFDVQGLKSKLLVTTRTQKVADIGFSMRLGLLSIESGWELLKKKAFPDSNITPDIAFDENLLRKVGKEMVQKCGSLPLTISLLGGVLSNKRKSVEEWELVKENINACLYRGDGMEKENEVEAVLHLSYEDLPYYLKPCFLYLGLQVKENEYVHADYVYKIWIAQGMISHGNREDESLVVTAELYLSELASRSIVQVEVFNEDSKSRKRYSWCKLHDVVRELCLSIAKRDGFGVQSLVYEGGKKSMHGSLSNVKTRHLVIFFEGQNEAELDGGDQFATSGDEDSCRNLRSLMLRNGNEEKVEFLDIGIDLQIFKLLRFLHFYELKFERRKVPKGIGNLIHLRYLCFFGCELDEVPSSIRNLSYLQTLDLTGSWDVRVPNVFNKLLRLKHLILPPYSDDRVGDFALELDKGLDELETLKGFDSSMHRLDFITRLKKLQSFSARIRDNESLLVVIDILTKEWNKLQYCFILIDESCNLTSTEEGLMLLQKVLTCPNIHELIINVKIGKQLGECRNHVSSSQIVTLNLLDCEIEDDPMEILGKLPVLRKLDLWRNSFVGKDMTCPAFSFPRLTELELKKLPNLREWRVEEGAMPLLSKIRIIACPELTMLPDGLRFISTLQELIITQMPGLGKRILALEEDGAQGDGEDFDKVRHVPSIIINN